MQLVVSDTELENIVEQLEGESLVALDTEFMREDTYFPILCLVQVCSADTLFCVDALALQQTATVAGLFRASGRTTVLHAAHQDLEMFFQETGELPANLFDTQIAAAMTGFDAQISYAQLVRELLGVELDKSQTRTDWRRRPLSDAQLEYAADDVRYLAQIQPLLAQRLQALGRTSWHKQECARMLQPATYTADPANAWRRLKGLARLESNARARACRLAAWREREAIERNRPRQWIVRDRLILDLARQCPGSNDELAEIESLPGPVARRYGARLIRMLAEPVESEEGVEIEAAVAPLTREQRELAKALRTCLSTCAEEHEIGAGLLANRVDLENLARGRRDLDVLKGWRREVAGDRLLALLEP